MSFIKLNKNITENASVLVRPNAHFVSSSYPSSNSEPVTGSESVKPFFSKCIKDPVKRNGDQNINYMYNEVSDELNHINNVANMLRESNPNADLTSLYEAKLDIVNNVSPNIDYQKTIDMFRFDMPIKFNKNINVKNVVKKNLNEYYKPYYPNLGYHYTNYNTLNFFNLEGDKNDSCFLYPGKDGIYTPSSAFTLDFWVNPRYSGMTYHAGTLFHMSSSIAVSLISGSNEKSNPENFKLLIQLSQSADTSPSSLNPNNLNLSHPNNLIFTSSAHIKKNHWHHITLRHDPDIASGNVELIIDDDFDNITTFNMTSSACTDNEYIALGNYLNTDSINASKFFNAINSTTHGVTKLNASTDIAVNQSEIFTHQMQAEIHEVKLFNAYLYDNEIGLINKKSIDDSLSPIDATPMYSKLLFYVPPYFFPTTNSREVFVSPFQTQTKTTSKPFNVDFSFSSNGKMINLENFTREFIKGEYPINFSLTASTIDSTIENITADEYIYNTGSLVKRNLAILPNDNGLIEPRYYSIKKDSIESESYYSGDYGKINLDNLIPIESFQSTIPYQDGALVLDWPTTYTVAQRLQDGSSNEISIIDISNLYYGNRINPSSIEIIDNDLTGTLKAVSIKLKDNGAGSLYRADCLSKQAKFNNVGDVIYEEGIITIKTPHLFYYCKDKIDIKLKGEQYIHTLTLNVPVYPHMFNSSSNPTYIKNPPDNSKNNENLNAIYISGVNIHDNNFNIIMKANFAQPILKTEEDEFIIRLKMDF